MPDRLPSLIVLVGFWIPPAIAGWMMAGFLRRNGIPERAIRTYTTLAAFVIAYAAAWFVLNVNAMPPYIPGAVLDPRVATPQAVNALALFTAALILPGSAVAFALAYRRRGRELART